MAFECRILADSSAPCGKRLTTFCVTYPRAIHSEIMTHRMLSKNSASSRAIPTEKLIQRVVDDPWIPDYIGANQKGMQPGTELSGDARAQAVDHWLSARNSAVTHARNLSFLGVHKGVVNRIIEPWMWITVIITGTEWENFFGLRCHKDAEPHFQHIARMMREEMLSSTPRPLKAGEWHLPLIDIVLDGPLVDEHIQEMIKKDGVSDPNGTVVSVMKQVLLRQISVGRIARVSYLTHDGRRDVKEDIALHDRLVAQTPLHASPAEPVAQAMDFPEWWKALGKIHNKTLYSMDLPSIQNWVAEARRMNFGLSPIPPWLMEAETLLAQMRSGNFMGFQQYRKTLDNENIGGPQL